ncbi:hypothetical protein BKA56DRAFT_623192 [Ilyonectria sp. MPI-CAGE-AT-0026]|nr:hypothetical protein BKA56DRAFT_623192 [Ilyonectria sp. MPI-CAGE-AT-0026]
MAPTRHAGSVPSWSATIWRPTKNLEDLRPDEYATRIVYIAAKVVQFAGMEAAASVESTQQWLDNENKLLSDLHRWDTKEIEETDLHTLNPFGLISCPMSCADVYHFAMITLLTNMLFIGGVDTYRTGRRQLENTFRVICGIASHDFDQGLPAFVTINALYAGESPPSHTWKGRTQTLGDSWTMFPNVCNENSSLEILQKTMDNSKVIATDVIHKLDRYWRISSY